MVAVAPPMVRLRASWHLGSGLNSGSDLLCARIIAGPPSGPEPSQATLHRASGRRWPPAKDPHVSALPPKRGDKVKGGAVSSAVSRCCHRLHRADRSGWLGNIKFITILVRFVNSDSFTQN